MRPSESPHMELGWVRVGLTVGGLEKLSEKVILTRAPKNDWIFTWEAKVREGFQVEGGGRKGPRGRKRLGIGMAMAWESQRRGWQ